MNRFINFLEGHIFDEFPNQSTFCVIRTPIGPVKSGNKGSTAGKFQVRDILMLEWMVHSKLQAMIANMMEDRAEEKAQCVL